MFCIKSVDGTYAEVNVAFVRRTGRTSKREVIGRTAGELFNEDLATRYEEQDHQVFESGEPLRDELELIRRPDGELGWYLTTKLPVADRLDPTSIVGLVSVSRDLQTPTTESIALESLQHVVAYVREHLPETIRVGEMAAVAECSTDQLDRRIRKVFGMTAKQYVLRVRVDRAAELLADTDLPLATVASTVGFYDQSDLTRRFARLIGQTPAQFRLATQPA
ncbi:MAG: AraC family transcriptional regulator [Actinomycetia bacterium]|nr:AraC family transcriptional regulator [Actinomycetes bacterium]MCP4224347.1 AraC family transcriptional regulator [Actinomycetes bacterium]MCP5035813.1 AraC family transcriptional regulator [Actinomycetes bacterium]